MIGKIKAVDPHFLVVSRLIHIFKHWPSSEEAAYNSFRKNKSGKAKIALQVLHRLC